MTVKLRKDDALSGNSLQTEAFPAEQSGADLLYGTSRVRYPTALPLPEKRSSEKS